MPLAALVLWCSGPAAASFVSGNKEIARLTSISPAALANLGGAKSLFISNEPELAVDLSAGTTQTMKLGFYGGLSKEYWAWLTPNIVPVNGQLVGISTGMPVPVFFSQTVDPNMLALLRVRRISDATGQVLNQVVAFSTTVYDAANYRLDVFPTAGSWEYNSKYNVVVGTDVLSEEGYQAEAIVFDFATKYKYVAGNVIKPIAGNATSVSPKQDVFPAGGYVEIDTAPVGALLTAANANFMVEYPGGQTGSFTEIDYCDNTSANGVCVPAPLVFPDGTMLVTLPYNASLGGNPIIYVLNTTTGKWEPLPTVTLTATTVSAYAPHFSFFMVGSAVVTAVSQEKVYPSPFRPNGPNAGVGAGKTGTDAGGITFVVPNGSHVEVYTVRGELVWEGRNTAGGSINWDTRSRSGIKATSGVYLYVVKSPVGKQTGKLAIIR